MNQTVVIAHRGASAYAPENTISAFNKAIDLGAGGIEIDVQLSRDQHPVVIHDERVDRTSNGTGWVKDKTLEELKTLDFGSWFSLEFKGEKIPTLEEVLKLLKPWDGLLNIEIKNGPVFYPGIEQRVVELVKEHNMEERTIISSFNHYSLVEVKRILPGIRTGLLYMAGLFEPWVYAKRLGAYAVHPLYYSIVPEIIKGCRENGIAVNPFTVDKPEHLKKIIMAGVNGVITNVPDIAVKVIKEAGG